MKERLTFDGLFCDIAMCQEVPCKYPDTGCSQRQVWERLKEYEDTGLSPDNIVKLLEERDRIIKCFKETGGCRTCNNDSFCKYEYPMDWQCDECNLIEDCPCYVCDRKSNWVWRGVKEKQA